MSVTLSIAGGGEPLELPADPVEMMQALLEELGQSRLELPSLGRETDSGREYDRAELRSLIDALEKALPALDRASARGPSIQTDLRKVKAALELFRKAWRLGRGVELSV